MKIEITINKEQADHLQAPHMFLDECEPACEILKKVQKEIGKKLKKCRKEDKGVKNETRK